MKIKYTKINKKIKKGPEFEEGLLNEWCYGSDKDKYFFSLLMPCDPVNFYRITYTFYKKSEKFRASFEELSKNLIESHCITRQVIA